MKSELRSLDKQFALVMDYNKSLVSSNRDIMNQLHEFKRLFEITMKKMVFITFHLAKDDKGELTKIVLEELENLGFKNKEDEKNTPNVKTQKLLKLLNEKLVLGSDVNNKLADTLLRAVYEYLNANNQIEVDKERFFLSFEKTTEFITNDDDNEHNLAYIVKNRKSESIDKDINSSVSAFEMTHKMDDQPSDNKSMMTDQNLVDFGEMDSINFGDSLLNTPLRPMSENNCINNDELGMYDWSKNTTNNANFL